MRSIRIILFVSMFLFIALAAFAAGGQEGGTDGVYIAIVSKGFQHEFWQTVKLGADTAAEELGIRATFEGPATESMIDVQINMVENAITNKATGLMLAALDAEALVPYVEQARDAGIPVLTFDSDVNSDIPLSFVATDNKAAAALGAEKLIGLIGGQGKVGVIVHDATSTTGIDRRDGALEALNSAPGITVLQPVYGAGDHSKSADLIVDMIRANPDLTAIFAGNEGSAVGAAIGLQDARREDIILVGFDSSEQEIALLKQGVIDGFVVQNPFQMGYLGVQNMYDAIQGKSISKRIDTGATYVDLSNLETEVIQKLLYPLGK